jgi:hypothetical protein
VMKQAPVVMTELSVSQLNAGAPLMFETLVVLRRFGYIMYDVIDIARWDRGALQLDAVFVHKDSPLWAADKTGFTPPQSPPKSNDLRSIYQRSLHELWRESKADGMKQMTEGKMRQGRKRRRA